MLPMIKQFFNAKAEAAKPRYTQVRVVKTWVGPDVAMFEFYNARTGLKIACPVQVNFEQHTWGADPLANRSQETLAAEIYNTLKDDWCDYPGLPAPVRKSVRGHYWRLVDFEGIVNL